MLITLGVFAGLVLLLHAAVEPPKVAEYALPMYPIFILIGIASVTGDRDAKGTSRQRR